MRQTKVDFSRPTGRKTERARERDRETAMATTMAKGKGDDNLGCRDQGRRLLLLWSKSDFHGRELEIWLVIGHLTHSKQSQVCNFSLSHSHSFLVISLLLAFFFALFQSLCHFWLCVDTILCFARNWMVSSKHFESVLFRSTHKIIDNQGLFCFECRWNQIVSTVSVETTRHFLPWY